MTSDPAELARLAACYCFTGASRSSVIIASVAGWDEGDNPQAASFVLQDILGNFWRLVASIDGELGCQTDPGPVTPDIILDDGAGGFWKLIVDTDGLRGAESNAGPATAVPILTDALGNQWSIVVDPDGNVGMESVP